jgi:hypothetical protein
LSLVGEFTPIEVVVSTHNPLLEGVLELSLRSATGAVPGQVTLLARLPDNKLHALNVDSHLLHLPTIPAATRHVVQVWRQLGMGWSYGAVVLLGAANRKILTRSPLLLLHQ